MKRHARPPRAASNLTDDDLQAVSGGFVKMIQQASKSAIETAKVIDGMPTRTNLELCDPNDPKPWDPCH